MGTQQDRAEHLWSVFALEVDAEWGDLFEFCHNGHSECAKEPSGECFAGEVDRRVLRRLMQESRA